MARDPRRHLRDIARPGHPGQNAARPGFGRVIFSLLRAGQPQGGPDRTQKPIAFRQRGPINRRALKRCARQHSELPRNTDLGHLPNLACGNKRSPLRKQLDILHASGAILDIPRIERPPRSSNAVPHIGHVTPNLRRITGLAQHIAAHRGHIRL